MRNIYAILAGVVGIVVGIIIMMIAGKAGLDRARNEAKTILKESKSKAENIVNQAKIDGKQQAFELKRQADREIKSRENRIQQTENKLTRDLDRLSLREETLNTKKKKLDEKAKLADTKLANSTKMEADLQEKIDSQIMVLEKVAEMSQEDARRELMDIVAKKCEKEVAVY